MDEIKPIASNVNAGNNIDLSGFKTQLLALGEQIIDPNKSSDPVAALKHNLSIKLRMIEIANKMGDSQKMAELNDEASQIQNDIAKNTSIFKK